AAQELRHTVLHAHGADHPRVAEAHHRRALRVVQEVRLDAERAQLIGPAAVVSWHATLPSSAPGAARSAPARYRAPRPPASAQRSVRRRSVRPSVSMRSAPWSAVLYTAA